MKAQEIPTYTMETLEPLLTQEDDTIRVFNFWATWCKPCVKELPAFEALEAHFAGKPFKLVLISLDFPQAKESSLIPFVERRQLKPEVWHLDPQMKDNVWIPKISEAWTGSIPATLVTARGGDLYEFKEQSFEQEALFEWIESIMEAEMTR
ncbi:TlpA disulfide reductase family protein [Pontibacter sp. G13]|uniref:TlpA disulfide reductase family protein n=1 Tax=Pontibacter sp. G13 TaxID=3074898 RepID=UPI0028897B3D|nr:TlpA disulfide reductase family protein [Pontibacter sp. G13]WNJ17599.1 TlpA disulfide reductase family protein [Pontibacter sp. G13]